MNLWKKNGYEVYFNKLNSTTWSLIEYVNTTAYLQLIHNTKDSMILYNPANKVYYNLNSVYLLTGSSLNFTILYSYSGAWLSLYYQSTSIYLI